VVNLFALSDHMSKVHFVLMYIDNVNIGWAISTGPNSKYNSIQDLKSSSIAISRIGRSFDSDYESDF
jgi:hypothetical protein